MNITKQEEVFDLEMLTVGSAVKVTNNGLNTVQAGYISTVNLQTVSLQTLNKTIVVKLSDVLGGDYTIEVLYDPSKADEGYVCIPKVEYATLLDSSDKLAALEAGGVDNWAYYGEAMQAYYNNQEAPEDGDE